MEDRSHLIGEIDPPLVPAELPGNRDPHLAGRARRGSDRYPGLPQGSHQPGDSARRLACIETRHGPLWPPQGRLGDRGLGLPPDVGARRSRVDPAEPLGATAAELADQPRAVLRAHVAAGALAGQDRAAADRAGLVGAHAPKLPVARSPKPRPRFPPWLLQQPSRQAARERARSARTRP